MTLCAAFSHVHPGQDFAAGLQVELELPLGAFRLDVLFGPSGCGKTTLLRCLAGLESPQSGLIVADGTPWFDATAGLHLAAEKRLVGCVFQEGRLFPHLSVEANLAFGLFAWPASERRRRVQELLALTGLEELAQRHPDQLSGGQRQRVALARALAPRPRLLLLDEPFAALDRPAREALRHDLRQTLRQEGLPALLVTHDPVEALALADQVLRMEAGRLVARGPATAVLTGSTGPEALGSILPVRVLGRTEGLLHLEVEGCPAAPLFAPDSGETLQRAHACIRAEGVSLETRDPLPEPLLQATPRNRLAARVTRLEPLGGLVRVYLEAGFPLQALVTAWACQDLDLREGREVWALVKASAIRVVGRED